MLVASSTTPTLWYQNKHGENSTGNEKTQGICEEGEKMKRKEGEETKDVENTVEHDEVKDARRDNQNEIL